MKKLLLTTFTGALLIAGAISQDNDTLTSWFPLTDHHGRMDTVARDQYASAIRRTAGMTSDPEAVNLAHQRGLNVLNLTWQDTGRYKGSSVGPNISDMTIQVGLGEPNVVPHPTCMPVIRYDNFSDKTCDIDPSDFTLLVGNEKGESLKRVSLREFLEDPCAYLHDPSSWLGQNRTLLAPRDSKVLVSAQACFLPVPKEGLAKFNPVLFNYQSSSGNPAVLTILATREGASTTVIDNKRDSFAEGSVWGQRLFHNADGQRASLTGQRLSDFVPSEGEVSKGPGLSMVLLIQIPLKQRWNRNQLMQEAAPMMGATKAAGGFGGGRARSDVESAVIGHGEAEGQFTEVDDLAIQRDPNFPIRVTVQFYKATSNGVVSPGDMDTIKQQIDSVYAHGENVGSLVVGGETGRPTEYVGSKVQPQGWWDRFWQRYEENTGVDRNEAMAKLRRLLGNDYMDRPVCDLYLRNLLRRG